MRLSVAIPVVDATATLGLGLFAPADAPPAASDRFPFLARRLRRPGKHLCERRGDAVDAG
jgi:hypothetical protein